MPAQGEMTAKIAAGYGSWRAYRGPVMLLVVKVVNSSKDWFEAGRA